VPRVNNSKADLLVRYKPVNLILTLSRQDSLYSAPATLTVERNSVVVVVVIIIIIIIIINDNLYRAICTRSTSMGRHNK